MNYSSIEDKALSINLQPSIYGTFAEIGAGQEVANYFYKVGAASGTIAKTISAYDMTLSDTHYGNTKRYVSKERLENMLTTEYDELIHCLKVKATVAHFFAFASTVQITNYQKTNKGSGWMGIKFQANPKAPASTCKLHFILHNQNPEEQKRIIGVLGVNLIHGVYENLSCPKQFTKSLGEGIRPGEIEINSIEVSGHDFHHTSTNQLSLMLVKFGLTKMIMFGNNGEIVQPLSALHKKDLLLVRGRFNPPTKVSVEMIEKAKLQLISKSEKSAMNILPVAEITFRCFEDNTEIGLDDLEHRIKMLSKMNVMVMITNFTYHSEFIDFISSYSTLKNLNLVLGLNNIRRVFSPRKTAKNEVSTLNFIQSIVKSGYTVLAFPELNSQGKLVGLLNLGLSNPEMTLLKYLVNLGAIEDIEHVEEKTLKIRTQDVIKAIDQNNVIWKEMLPSSITELLESNVYNRATKNSHTSGF